MSYNMVLAGPFLGVPAGSKLVALMAGVEGSTNAATVASLSAKNLMESVT